MSSPTSELYRLTRRRAAAAITAVGVLWDRIDPSGDWLAQWQAQLPTALALTSAAQFGAATDAANTVPLELAASGYRERQLAKVEPRGFVGWMQDADDVGASDLAVALTGPVRVARDLTSGDEAARLLAGRAALQGLVRTAVTDAARESSGVQIVATERAVAVWFEPPPYCQRCAVLIGKRVKLTTQFRRHPQCDGQVQVMSERDDRALSTASVDQITDLTEAQRQAIEDGADVNQVINASRPQPRGGTTLRNRGLSTTAGARRGQTRLTPKGVYQLAGDDREFAIELLRANGYVR